MLRALLVVIALQGAPPPASGEPAPAQTQTAVAAPDTTRPRREAVVATRREAPRAPAQTLSVPERLFGPGWVVFPARLVLVTIFFAVAVFAGSGGLWAGYRVAHTLKHSDWKEPPRRLKRGEIGAAGATIALEWEERLTSNESGDGRRDQQIAALWKAVNQLTTRVNALSASIGLLTEENHEPGSEHDAG